jgi:hypothetical protein
MARRKQKLINGTFTHRRTEADYMGVLLDTVPIDDWRTVIQTAVAAAKAGMRAPGRGWRNISSGAPAPLHRRR